MAEPMPPVTFHATDNETPFGGALCGFKPEGEEGIWVTQLISDVNCVLCLEAL